MPLRPAPYDTLIDAETWAFIDASAAHYGEDSATLDIAGQRRMYDALCRAFDAGRPTGVTVEDSAIAGPAAPIPVRTYAPAPAAPRALVIYYHGGGYVLGGLDSHDSICAEICAATGYTVISVDYRLAPEHRHPAQFADALGAFREIAGPSSLPVILAGDSAGGNLAAAVSWATRGDTLRPAGQVLIYPALGADLSTGTFVTHAAAPMLTTADMRLYDELRAGGEPPVTDPSFTPLAADAYAGLPPTLVFTAECDPLSGDGPTYCARLVAAGGKARCTEEKGLVHGYLRARHSVARARQSFARIVDGIAALGRGDWPD